MKEILFLLTFLFFINFSACESKSFEYENEDINLNQDEEILTEEKDNSSKDKEAEPENKTVYRRLVNRAQTSPKREQKKTLDVTLKSLEKQKEDFKKFKNRELWLLKNESEILDYHP